MKRRFVPKTEAKRKQSAFAREAFSFFVQLDSPKKQMFGYCKLKRGTVWRWRYGYTGKVANALLAQSSPVSYSHTPFSAVVRFSNPSSVTRISSSILTPPTAQYLSNTALSINLPMPSPSSK